MRLDTYIQEYFKKTYDFTASRRFVGNLIKLGFFKVNDKLNKKKAFDFKEGKHVLSYDRKELANRIALYCGQESNSQEGQEWSKSQTPEGIFSIQKLQDKLSITKPLLKEDIILENKDFMVVYKESGVVVHPAKSVKPQDTLLYKILAYLYLNKQEKDFFNLPRGGLLHRLDRQTSGLVLVAKHQKSYNILQEQFLQRTIKKYYIAQVEYSKKQLSQIKSSFKNIDEVSDKIPKNWQKIVKEQNGYFMSGVMFRSRENNKKMVFQLNKKSFVKKYLLAQSTFWLIAKDEKYLYLAVLLHTGRNHQIRAQCNYLGLPIKDDITYGAKNDQTYRNSIGLQAVRLEFKYENKEYIVENPRVEFE